VLNIEKEVEECDATMMPLPLKGANKFLQYFNSPLGVRASYSVLKLLTGFMTAAFIAWKLMVNNAIKIAIKPASANSHQLRSTL